MKPFDVQVPAERFDARAAVTGTRVHTSPESARIILMRFFSKNAKMHAALQSASKLWRPCNCGILISVLVGGNCKSR